TSSPGTPGAVHFEPALDAKRRAFAGLASGSALKVLLLFREPFWEMLDDGRYADGAFFLHAPGASFPTFWTTLPMRSALLTAWAGGPRGAKLAGARFEHIVQEALASLAQVFGERVVAE